MIYTVKDFIILSEAEVDFFLELSCFFYDLADVGNLISGSSVFSNSSLNIWKFSVHILLKPCLENLSITLPRGMGFDSERDFTLLLSCRGFSFALGRGVSFSGGIQHSPVNGCLAISCNFGVLRR